jgi:large subunit ribosomal protein L35
MIKALKYTPNSIRQIFSNFSFVNWLIILPLRSVFQLYIFVMPKMKTHSSAKKRFSVTGKGKVKRNRARMRHLMRKKSTKAKRHLRGSVIVDKTEHARIQRLLVS